MAQVDEPETRSLSVPVTSISPEAGSSADWPPNTRAGSREMSVDTFVKRVYLAAW